jgi:WD40 repeat protein
VSTIFISHSNLDSDTASKIHAWLEEQGHHSVFLDFDPQVGIPAGRQWEKELYSRLKSCRAVIALLSSHWISSRWCFAEVAIARSLGKHVFPIKISAAETDALLADRQLIDLTHDEAEAFERLARGLQAAGLRAGDVFEWNRDRSPYPGLPAFQEEDAAVYFGREDDIGNGLDVLNQVRRYGGSRFVLVMGASGSGKSSLVRAGMIPRLKRDADQWIVLDPMRPGEQPFPELSSVLAAAFKPTGRDVDWKDIHRQLTAAGEQGGGDAIRAEFEKLVLDLRLRAASRDATIVLTIDQFEELLSRPPEHSSTMFIAFLHTLLSSAQESVIVLATMRSDFLDVLQRTRPIGSLEAERIVLSPLSIEGLTQAIEQPAELAGIDLGRGLVQAILNEANTGDALPLVAFTLRQLYEDYADDSLITVEEFREQLGGLSGSVAKVASAVLTSQSLSGEDEEQLRRAFLAMVRINETGQYSRRPVRWDALPPRVHPFIEAFVRARLLVSKETDGKREVEIAHEALFRAWDKLRGWIEQSAEELRLREELHEASSRWNQQGGSEEYLWGGTRLARAVELRNKARLGLSDADLAFLQNSERVAKRAQAQRTRSRRFVVTAALVIAAFMTLLAVRERTARTEAEKQRQVALSGRLAAQSLGFQDGALDLALLLGVQAIRTARIIEAPRSLLAGLIKAAHLQRFIENSGSAAGMIVMDPTGKRMAVTAGFGALIYEIAKPDAGGELFQPGGNDITQSIAAIAFSPDGKTLAISNVSDQITLWDVAKHRLIGQIRAGPGLSLRTLAFAPGDTILVSGGCPIGDEWPCDTGAIYLWDTRSQEAIGAPLLGGRGPIKAIAFNKDSSALFSGAADGLIRLWDLSSHRSVRTMEGPPHGTNDLAVSPDGKALAAAGEDGEILLWNLTTAKPEVHRLTGHSASVTEVDFSPQGGILVSGSEDRTIRFWDSESGNPMVPVLRAHATAVRALAFSPTSELLASGSDDGTVILWDLLDSESIHATSYLTQPISSVAATPDGRFVAFGGSQGVVMAYEGGERWLEVKTDTRKPVHVAINSKAGLLAAGGCGAIREERLLSVCTQGTVWIWDLSSPERKAVLKADTAAISSLAFDPAGSMLVAGDEGGGIRIWDVKTMTLRPPLLQQHTAEVQKLAFSPDGKRLASAGYDRKLILWDPQTGKRVSQLGEPLGTVLSVAFSPDGKLLASGGGDTKVYLWNVSTGQQAYPPLTGHTSSVFDVAFSPAGDILASASHDSTVVLWSVPTQGVFGRLLGHAGPVNGLSFSDDGRVLYSVGDDGKAFRWDVSTESWIRLACSKANRNLTLSEWRQYVGSGPYGKTCESNPVHPSVVQWGKDLAAAGDIKAGIGVLQRARALDSNLDFDPEREARHAAAQSLARQGQAASGEGNISEALDLYARALEVGVDSDVSPESWNSLCWSGSLNGFAQAVMHACGNAVKLASDEEKPFFQDSRGVARALTGDSKGAMEDFESFATWTHGHPEYGAHGQRREEWIRQLARGVNPFDSLTIDQLRRE